MRRGPEGRGAGLPFSLPSPPLAGPLLTNNSYPGPLGQKECSFGADHEGLEYNGEGEDATRSEQQQQQQ